MSLPSGFLWYWLCNHSDDMVDDMRPGCILFLSLVKIPRRILSTGEKAIKKLLAVLGLKFSFPKSQTGDFFPEITFYLLSFLGGHRLCPVYI